MKKIALFAVSLAALPYLVFAADAFSIIVTIGNILGIIIPILITLAVIYFIWGVIQYISGDEEKKKEGRSKIINGLIGLFVIVAFWGIIRIVTDTFGVGPEQLNQSAIPCIPNPAAGIDCPGSGR